MGIPLDADFDGDQSWFGMSDHGRGRFCGNHQAVTSILNASAEIVVFGKIFTSAEHPRWAEAACVRDGRFVYVGSREGAQAFVSAQTTVVDVGEHLILPGFIAWSTQSHNSVINPCFSWC